MNESRQIVWAVVVEELDGRRDADDTVSTVHLFGEPEHARDFAIKRANELEYHWSHGGLYVDFDNGNGTVHWFALPVNEGTIP
jgi:hypothetical protein